MQSSSPMQQTTPLVSVVIPVFNAQAYIAEAVESILAQTYTHFELILIDDASTDGTLEILQRYAAQDARIRLLINERNLNITPTLNRGLQEARGELIARMDADDISLPDRLEKQVAFLQSHPEIGLISGRALAIDAKGEVIPDEFSLIREPGVIRWLLHFTCPITHPAVMGRLDLFLQAGGYDPEIPFAEDYALWQKMSTFTNLSNLEDFLIKKRAHNQSIGVTRRETMMHSHMLVQQRAISVLLNRPVDLEEIRGLRNLSKSVPPKDSIALIKRCHAAFLAQNTLTPREKRLVARDCAFRIYRIANFNRRDKAFWGDLALSFIKNPALLGRVGKALGRRLQGKSQSVEGER